MSWWSWTLEAVGLTGAGIVGMKRWWGWAILFGNAILWAVYGIRSKQYGFATASLFYGPLYAHNTLRWWRQQHKRSVIHDDTQAV